MQGGVDVGQDVFSSAVGRNAQANSGRGTLAGQKWSVARDLCCVARTG